MLNKYGKFFQDKSIVEANILILKQLSLINDKCINFEDVINMVKELLRAETIYKNQGSLKGQAISELLIGHIIVSEFLGY